LPSAWREPVFLPDFIHFTDNFLQNYLRLTPSQRGIFYEAFHQGENLHQNQTSSFIFSVCKLQTEANRYPAKTEPIILAKNYLSIKNKKG